MTKDEIAVIFTTYSDEEIKELGIYIDPLITDNFSFEEMEKLLIKRAENFSTEEATVILNKLFDEFRFIYNRSYLDSSFDNQDGFTSGFINSNDFFNGNGEFCDWPDPDCNRPQNQMPPPCPERPETNYINLQSRPCVSRAIISSECGKQFGTTDCDYIYDWSTTIDEYNNPGNYNFYWWTDNSFYRGIYGFMNSQDCNISGIPKADAPKRMSVFLGDRHAIAMSLTWAAFICKHDAFVGATLFGSTSRDVACGTNSIGQN